MSSDPRNRPGCCSLFSQFPFVALLGAGAAVASAILTPSGINLITALVASGGLPLPADIVAIGVTALTAVTGVTLGLASLTVVLSFFSREQLRQSCCLSCLGRIIGFLWSATFPRLIAFLVACLLVVHLVLLVAYGAILAIIFLFNTILCPQIGKLEEIFGDIRATASRAGQDVDLPDNPIRALCAVAKAGQMTTIYLVAGEILFAISAGAMLMSLGGTIAFNVMHNRAARIERNDNKVAAAAAAAAP
jgi:hypothetical protein